MFFKKMFFEQKLKKERTIKQLKQEGIEISMEGKGKVIANILIERFWRTLKYDYIYINPTTMVWSCKKE